MGDPGRCQNGCNDTFVLGLLLRKAAFRDAIIAVEQVVKSRLRLFSKFS